MQYGGGRRGINIGNIIGDPFALATISISAVSRILFLGRRLHRQSKALPMVMSCASLVQNWSLIV